MSDYKKLLLTPQWQRKKSEIQMKHDFTCQHCLINGMTVHVHHNYYIQGRKPWEYDDDCFALLCEYCHSKFHKEQEELKAEIRSLDSSYFNIVTGFIKGLQGKKMNAFSCFEEADGYLKATTRMELDDIYKLIEEVKSE